MTTMVMKPRARPISGAKTMNHPILPKPLETTESKPDLATAAPTMPPTRACDDELGSPRYHVSMFQPMAPMRPAKITPMESTSCSTTSLAIVLATWVLKMRKAMKLNVAAQITAKRGDSTRVATIVAIELAASCIPFVKSNVRATAITNHRAASSTVGLAVLESDALDDVGHPFDLVHGVLDGLHDVFPTEHVEGVEVAGEQVGDRLAVEPVSLALELVDGLEVGFEALQLRQLGDVRDVVIDRHVRGFTGVPDRRAEL